MNTSGVIEFYNDRFLLKFSNRDIFSSGSSEPSKSSNYKYHFFKSFLVNDDEPDENTIDDRSSYYRSKRNIERLYYLNDWDFFVTLTFADQSLSNEDLLKKALERLKYLIKKNSLYSYLLVPELHKKSGVLHLHGFIRCSTDSVVDSGTVKIPIKKKPIRKSLWISKYQDQSPTPVFNWSDWNLGFSVLMAIDKNQSDLVFGYCVKYVLKNIDNVCFSNRVKGHRYFCGGDVNREVTKINFDHNTYNFNILPSIPKIITSHIPNTDIKISYLSIPYKEADKYNLQDFEFYPEIIKRME